MKMNIYRKAGMMIAVPTLFVVLSMSCVMAEPDENLNAIWDNPNIRVTATDCKSDHWYQIRYYPPGNTPAEVGVPGDAYYTACDPWNPDSGDAHSEEFNVMSSGASPIEGEWTVGLYKAGDGAIPGDGVKCARVFVTLYVPIPEFATITIPIVAILGLVAFYHRKQKK